MFCNVSWSVTWSITWSSNWYVTWCVMMSHDEDGMSWHWWRRFELEDWFVQDNFYQTPPPSHHKYWFKSENFFLRIYNPTLTIYLNRIKLFLLANLRSGAWHILNFHFCKFENFQKNLKFLIILEKNLSNHVVIQVCYNALWFLSLCIFDRNTFNIKR